MPVVPKARLASLVPVAALITACAGETGGDRTVAAADGTTIVYDVRGIGSPALVFIHCWACNRSFWHEQVDVFAQDHTVLNIDLPGHGAAGRDRSAWTLAAYADDVVRVVEDAGLDEVVLVGHSMGGPVGLLAAMRLGERAAGVVCVDALHDAEFTWPEEVAQQWIASFEQDYETAMRAGVASMVPSDSTLREWIVGQGLLADRAAMLALVREFEAFDLAATFSAVDAPVRCVNAAPYGQFSLPTAIETNRRYADFDAALMEGVGHYLHLERPETFNRLMRDFVHDMTEMR